MNVSCKCLVAFLLTLSSARVETMVWFSVDEGRQIWTRNCDFTSVNVIREVRSPKGECGGLCYEHPDCRRFTWHNANGGTCQFRALDGGCMKVLNGAICGYVPSKMTSNDIKWMAFPSQRIRIGVGCKYTGITIFELIIGLDDCKSECRIREECFGFNYQSGKCQLKSLGELVASVHDVCGEVMDRNHQGSSTRGHAVQACNEYKSQVSLNPGYRIYNGSPARQNEFPWMAALFYIHISKFYFMCGGTIISDYFILSAAHCVVSSDGPLPADVVRLGTNVRDDTSSEDILVESCKVREDFVWNERKNDIALIKLRTRINFNERIYPACLRVDDNDLPRSQELIVSGWGKTGGENMSNILRKTSLKTVELQECQTAWRKKGSEARYQINESQYCAADRVNGSDARKGDSGGPLQMFDDSPLAIVVGVVSFGHDENGTVYPGVYTRVASYLTWIEDHVWGN